MEFEKELQALLNKYSLENGSDTPDYVLAGYLMTCLNAFDGAVNWRESSKEPVADEEVLSEG